MADLYMVQRSWHEDLNKVEHYKGISDENGPATELIGADENGTSSESGAAIEGADSSGETNALAGADSTAEADLYDDQEELHKDYFQVPAGCELSHADPHFVAYSGEEYHYRFYYVPDEELLAYAEDGKQTYQGYKLTTVATTDSPYGQVIIAMRNDKNYYMYYGFTADGVVNFEFNNNDCNEIDRAECIRLVNRVIR